MLPGSLRRRQHLNRTDRITMKSAALEHGRQQAAKLGRRQHPIVIGRGPGAAQRLKQRQHLPTGLISRQPLAGANPAQQLLKPIEMVAKRLLATLRCGGIEESLEGGRRRRRIALRRILLRVGLSVLTEWPAWAQAQPAAQIAMTGRAALDPAPHRTLRIRTDIGPHEG